MKRNLLTTVLTLAALAAGAATPTVVNIWPEGQMPYDNEMKEAEQIDSKGGVTGVSVPQLTIYTPANFGIRQEANAKVAIVSCPGGAYRFQSPNASHDMADWFNAQGITFAVLKYRLPNGGHYDATMADGLQAMRVMRQWAEENGVDYVGIMGASAGGHLASSIATHYTDSVTRPDFQILFYPVITMDSTYTHRGSRLNLLGQNPSNELVTLYSNDLQVTPDTPPAILLGCYDDKVVPIRNSVDYFTALRANNVPASLLIYTSGDHGWGHIHPIRYRQAWHDDLTQWLQNEVIKKLK